LPTQLQFEIFGTWLATVAKRGDNPFKKSSFQQYMRHMATLFEADFPPPCLNVARSPKSVRFIAAVSRSLDSTKQRARPVQIADLFLFCSRLPLYYSPLLAKLARVIALVTFWGCLRLGTMLQDTTSLLQVITWRDFFFDGHRLFVSIFRDKTVKRYDDCHRIMLEPLEAGDQLICPVQAFVSYVSECSARGFNLDHSFASFSADHAPLSFDKFILMMNNLVPSRPSTLSVKGYFTGHSFRRGHVQAAIAAGIEVDDLMLFGNWKSAPSVTNYTAGAVKASSLSSVLFRR
jgi:hypothetical protein